MEIARGIETDAMLNHTSCRKHSSNGVQSETSEQRIISLGELFEPNSQPKYRCDDDLDETASQP
jgi:hypothetical protein